MEEAAGVPHALPDSGNARVQIELARAGKHEATGPAILVDDLLQVRKEFGETLGLVEHRPVSVPLQKTTAFWVAAQRISGFSSDT